MWCFLTNQVALPWAPKVWSNRGKGTQSSRAGNDSEVCELCGHEQYESKRRDPKSKQSKAKRDILKMRRVESLLVVFFVLFLQDSKIMSEKTL